MTTPTLMFQGTGSDVGKSLIVAGICRHLSNLGYKVLPFKPQNMSNNAAVTVDGGEIGRAQALQARACRADPIVDMNPVLLKPQSEIGAQVVVHGKMRGSMKAREYQTCKQELLPAVLESFERLKEQADIVIVEGAGSASEVNLRAGDIANMGFAEAAKVPTILIGDIDRGGVIASLVGTWNIVPASDQRLIKGYLINKFRGDASLFDSGLKIITEASGIPSMGVVPFFPAASRLPAEDAMALADKGKGQSGSIKIAIPQLSRIQNFDDFDPLEQEPDVHLDIVEPGRALPGDADLVILPGSKATIADLKFFREQGWDIDLAAHLRRGGQVLGICAGFQMLGTSVTDPDGIEGNIKEASGLSYLNTTTELTGSKILTAVTGHDNINGEAVTGYEMHIGITEGDDKSRPFLTVNGKPEGAISADGRVMACYVHGLFASDAFRSAFLSSIRERENSGLAFEQTIDETLDRLAEHLAQHLDIDAMLAIAKASV
jgi:adenosylcobyric acid synthase